MTKFFRNQSFFIKLHLPIEIFVILIFSYLIVAMNLFPFLLVNPWTVTTPFFKSVFIIVIVGFFSLKPKIYHSSK